MLGHNRLFSCDRGCQLRHSSVYLCIQQSMSTVPYHKPVAIKTLVLQGGWVDASVWQPHSSRAAGAAYHREIRGLSHQALCGLADWRVSAVEHSNVITNVIISFSWVTWNHIFLYLFKISP